MLEFQFELTYFEAVENDIENAKKWYYDINLGSGLDERFAESILEIMYKIQKNPYIYHPVFEIIRVAHPKFFPFGVHFAINESDKNIVIIAILHNKQDKNKLFERF